MRAVAIAAAVTSGTARILSSSTGRILSSSGKDRNKKPTAAPEKAPPAEATPAEAEGPTPAPISKAQATVAGILAEGEAMVARAKAVNKQYRDERETVKKNSADLITKRAEKVKAFEEEDHEGEVAKKFEAMQKAASAMGDKPVIGDAAGTFKFEEAKKEFDEAKAALIKIAKKNPGTPADVKDQVRANYTALKKKDDTQHQKELDAIDDQLHKNDKHVEALDKLIIILDKPQSEAYNYKKMQNKHGARLGVKELEALKLNHAADELAANNAIAKFEEEKKKGFSD